MEDIVRETGLAKGALYLYYDSKDDLVVAILDRILQRDYGDGKFGRDTDEGR